MHANGLGLNTNVATINRANLSFPQHAEHALRCFTWIMQQRVRLCSGNKRAVAIVVAVREDFGRGLQSQFLRRSKQFGSGRRE